MGTRWARAARASPAPLRIDGLETAWRADGGTIDIVRSVQDADQGFKVPQRAPSTCRVHSKDSLRAA